MRSAGKVVLLFAFIVLLFNVRSLGQVTIINDSFDDGNISANPTWSNNTSAFTVSTSSPLVGSHSLISNTGNTPSYIYTQFATNTNLTSQNYTWNLTYRASSGSTPDELPYGAAITAGTNHWRFWIAADGTNATSCDGFYISHSAGNLKFCRKKNNSTWDITTYAISLNTTYSIKIVRRYDGYFDFYVDAGTAEATTIRWSGWATDVFNSGNTDIYMILHANETSANRFQWDNAGLFSKSLTIAQLTNGVYTGDLQEGMTNIPVIGFSATAIGTITLEDVKIQNTNTNSQGNFVNLKLIKSIDNDFSTAGDNTVMLGITFSLNGSWIFIEDINTTMNNSSANFFLTMDNINNNGGSPPSSIQFSMSCNNNCGVPYTNVVTTNAEKVNDFSFSTPTFTVLRVFKWRNTTVVGDYTDNWQNSSAWEPYRTDPSPNDVLEFSKGGTVSPLNIPSESVKKIIFKNNTTVNITTSSLSNGSATLSIVGGSDDDFRIENGSSLNVTSTGNNFTVSVLTSASAEILGNLTYSGKSHQLYAADANAIKFKSGSIFTGGTGLLGNPFGSTVASSVIFESGALLIDQAALDYFSNANVLTFNTGSTYRHSTNTTASLHNKTFANFDINTAAIFHINANTININGDLTGLGTLVFTTGTLNLSGNYSNTGALTSGTGTINYVGTNQNVKVATYANVNFKTGGTKTLLGSILFAGSSAGNFTVDLGVKLVAAAYTITANTAGSSFVINGHLTTTNTVALSGSTSATLRSTNSPTVALGANSTIEYNATTTQAITARTDYANIIASGTGTKNVANITMNGNLEIASGVFFTLSSSTLAGTITTSGTGTLRTSNTGLTPVPSGVTWNFTYDANGSSQSIVAGNYSDLTLTGSGTKTARGDISVSGNLNINSGRTFTMGTYLLTSVGSTTGTGTLRTDNNTVNPIPSNVTWSCTVLYNGASQTIVPGNYKAISIAGSGTKTANQNIIMDGALNIASSNMLDIQTYTIQGMTSTVGTGRLRTANTTNQPLPSDFTWTFTIEFFATSGDQYVVPGDYTALMFTGAKGANNIYMANNDTIYLSGTITNSATFSGGAYILTGNTIILDGASQTINAFTFNNLSIEGTGDKTAGGTLNVLGNLNIVSGRILIMSSRQLTGITSTSGAGTLRTAYTSANAIPANKTWTFTVEYNTNSSQIVSAGNYSNLTILGTKGTNSVTFANGGTIAVSGVFNPAATFTNPAGNYIVTNNTFEYNGTTQNVPALIYNNLKISGSADKSLTGTVQVNGTLDLNANDLFLNANDLVLNGGVNYGTGQLKAGTCGSPNGSITIAGSGTLNNFKLKQGDHYLNNFTINRNASITLTDNISIAQTLALTQGVLVTDKKIGFNTGNNPITRNTGILTLEPNAIVEFGDCNNSGNAFIIPDDLFTTAPTFKDLIVNRNSGITLNNQMLNITGTLRLSSGTINTNDKITLISNATNTARVDEISCVECDIVGDVIVQRFIPGGPGKRRWRLIASPANVNGKTSLSEMIDDVLITGPGGASNGFDESPNNNASVKIYNESVPGSSSQGWVLPSTINTEYTTGTGICLFVRGDRFTVDPYITWAEANDATLTFKGDLSLRNVSLPVSYTNNSDSADGWNLVANPYASTISWKKQEAWQKTNIQNKIWIYNPNTGSYGAYTGGLNLGTNGCTPFIASGQAFFVKATSASPQLVITESAKVDSTPSNFFRAATEYNVLKIFLTKDSINTDEAVLYLKEGASKRSGDENDVTKFFNDNLNFYLKSAENVNLAINEYPIPQANDTVKVSVFSYANGVNWEGEYRFDFKNLESLYNNIDVYFEDTYANSIINIKEISSYTFAINADALSMGNNRFRIILGRNNNPNGIDEIKTNSLSVYPNPAEDVLNIINQSEEATKIWLRDLNGREMYSQELQKGKNSIDISGINAGMYFIQTEQGKVQKLIIR